MQVGGESSYFAKKRIGGRKHIQVRVQLSVLASARRFTYRLFNFLKQPCFRGITSMEWCSADPDLLLTCGKDTKLYLWNPNTGQFLAEVPYSARNWPNLVSIIDFESCFGGIEYRFVEDSRNKCGWVPRFVEELVKLGFNGSPR